MAKYSIADAARRAKIARSTMYERYINTGKITVEKVIMNGIDRTVIDSAEWERVFATTPADTSRLQVADTGDGHLRTPPDSSMIRLLQDQLQESRQREQWMQNQIDKLTEAIRLIEHRPLPDQADQDQKTADQKHQVIDSLIKQLIETPKEEERPSWIVRVLTKKIW